ncbi:hypothetical protein [Camelpox virus]|uniref:Protein OPG050 n=4 Tax=Camelpox virus TaxID=28873 RepID=Q8V2X6_CAMPM|nr:hypothetical protein CamMLVgp041 [Camelpox virus]AAG37500.1 CMP41L [Camelpox virus CMS]AAL73748.1 hypothetical protein [Camelpox virus M-96]AKU40410.1 hypothetical protein TT95_00052 [Camelpox virus]
MKKNQINTLDIKRRYRHAIESVYFLKVFIKMSKILTFVKNKIIDLIKNDQIKYSRVTTIEESDSLLPVDEVYANHGFDCVEMIDENIINENLEQYKTDSFLQ